jgi:lipoprotein-releasing system permease protein
MLLELAIGLRYLRARQGERFVSLIALISLGGVIIGTLALSVVLSVMSGFEHDLRRRLLAFNPHVLVRLNDDRESAALATLARVIEQVDGVEAVAPYVASQVMAAAVGIAGSPGYMSGAIARGVMVRDNPTLGELQRTLSSGSLNALGVPFSVITDQGDQKREVKLDGVILGDALAAELGLRIGQPVTLISPASFQTGDAIPRLKRYAIVGLFHSGMDEYDAALVFMGLDDARTLFRGDSQLEQGLQVQVKDLFQAPAIARRIAALSGPGFTVEDWTRSDQSLFSALKLEKTAYFLVLLLIVLVAAFNIVATLAMVVIERRKEIAILRAMGAQTRSIAAIFLLQGALLGTVGSVVGVGTGFVLSYVIDRYHLIHLPPQSFIVSVVPVELDPVNFLMVAAAAIVLCVLAALYPALQARSLSPVEVIRYE